jgi:lipid A 3-O-deacylase
VGSFRNKLRASAVSGLAAAAVSLLPPAARAKELTSPYGAFVEAGASKDARSAVAGIAWTWVQPSRWGAGHASGYLETSVGEWACKRRAGDDYHGCSTQLGVTPVIRYTPDTWDHWYMELGIGANAIVPAWKTEKRRFATEFNFGDHIGLGRKFGDQGRDEIELRAEHYSNGGYKLPNPGENWLQLRYMRWF